MTWNFFLGGGGITLLRESLTYMTQIKVKVHPITGPDEGPRRGVEL
jgi:hypothetical protein